MLDAVDATPKDVRMAVAAMLAPSYRQAALRLRDEIAALPEPTYAATLLEQLAVEKRPIISL